MTTGGGGSDQGTDSELEQTLTVLTICGGTISRRGSGEAGRQAEGG